MITEFLNYLSTIRGYSDNTVIAYERDLRDFVSFASGYTWRTVTPELVENYVIDLCERELEPATVKRHISSVRAIYRFMISHGMTDNNPAKYISTPKLAKKQPNTVNIDAIREVITDNRIGLKTRCQIALLTETGIRLQEMLDMDTADVNPKQNSIRIMGKGNKERIVYYGETTRNLMNKYLGSRRGKIFSDTQREVRTEVYYALCTHTTGRQLSPHALRHTYATIMLNNGAQLKTVSQLLGHDSVKTTERYAQMSNPTLRAQYINFKPNFS